jgi:hypothetical protein
VTPVLKRLLLVCAPPLLALAGCGGEPEDSPEDQVRARIEQAEALAEQRDAKALKELISEDYRDDRKRDRRAVAQLLAYYFFRHKSVHLLVHTESIEIPEPGLARVTLYVAMAGKPLDGVGELLDLRASLYRFDLELRNRVDEEGWRLTTGRWRPVERRDFLDAVPADLST